MKITKATVGLREGLVGVLVILPASFRTNYYTGKLHRAKRDDTEMVSPLSLEAIYEQETIFFSYNSVF